MKLIKLMYKFDTPLKERVISFFPRDIEKTLKEEYILVSDSKYRLLQLNKVGMFLYYEFPETSNVLMDDYCIIKKIIEPSTFDEETFDCSEYNLNDVIFIYKESPKVPTEPKKPKFHEGTFNYELSKFDKELIQKNYEKEIEKYKEELQTYETELKTYIEKEVSLPLFGAIGVITQPVTKIPDTNLRIIGDKVLKIFTSVRDKTTKDCFQFCVNGKLPKDVGTLVTKQVGGLKAGTSISNISLYEIIKKAFGLETEDEKVGTIQSSKQQETPQQIRTMSIEEEIISPSVTMKVSPTSITEPTNIVVSYKITKGTGNIVKVELYQNNELIVTEENEISNEYEIEGVDKTTTFKIVVMDSNDKKVEVTKKVTLKN